MKLIWVAPLILGLLVGCGADEETKVVPGRPSDQVEGRAIAVRLPVGELNVTVGAPITDSIAGERAADGDEHRVPSEGSFIPISWDFDALERIPGRAYYGQEPLPAEVALRMGDQVIDLPEPYVVRGIGIGTAPVRVFYVPSKQADPRVSLEVTYDGLTQLADAATGEVAPSVASLLYADPVAAPDVDCDSLTSTRYPRLRIDPACYATVERVPYLPEFGWAPDDESYPVVSYGLDLRSPSVGRLEWEAASVVGTATLDGAGPILVVSTSADPNVPHAHYLRASEVFAARPPGGEAKVSATFTVEPPNEGATEPRKITLRAAIPLP